MKTPDYLSYQRYKKKRDSNPDKRMLVFVTTFFATLLLFTVIAKSLSPDVDVTIGDESQTDAKETGLGVKRFIDERLKMIQLDDSSAGVSVKEPPKQHQEYYEDFDSFLQETEEKVSLPTKTDTYSEEENLEELVQSAPKEQKLANKDLSRPFESVKTSKIYVGRYSTIEQAKVAQEILADSDLGVNPFIKDLGRYYTLQIGVYSSRAKAEEITSRLLENNFPARVVQE